MRLDAITTTSCLGLLLLLPACGDDGGGGSSAGGTDGAGTSASPDDGADDESGGEPPEDQPDENGDRCGSDVYGWETNCLVTEVTASASDKDEIPGAPVSGHGTGRTLCCEGSPPVATADGGCSSICLLEVCEAARIDHMNRCATCGPLDCGFDMTDCLDGGDHTQWVTCATPAQLPYGYTLTASCTAVNNETRNPDGSFGFLEDPNETMTDPDICNPPGNLEHDPPRGLGQYKGSESEGTVARVTWAMADAAGEEQSEALHAGMEYALLPCAAASHECMQLTALELGLPPTEVLGLTLTGARLGVIAVTEAPMVDREGRFHFSEGSLRVLLQAHVNGFPLVLTGWNADPPQGQLSPAGDQLSLTGLRFEFADSFITAALEVELHGRYDARRPHAQITRTTEPERCDAPVTMLATSWDDDQDPLTHSWWIRNVGSFEGPMVELPLPAGEHDVRLTSFDSTGLFDTQTMRYARRCR